MFDYLPFDKKLVDLKNFSVVFKIIDNSLDGRIFFGYRVANSRPEGEY